MCKLFAIKHNDTPRGGFNIQRKERESEREKAKSERESGEVKGELGRGVERKERTRREGQIERISSSRTSEALKEMRDLTHYMSTYLSLIIFKPLSVTSPSPRHTSKTLPSVSPFSQSTLSSLLSLSQLSPPSDSSVSPSELNQFLIMRSPPILRIFNPP